MFKGLGGLGNLGNIAAMVGKLQDIPQKIQELNEAMRLERISATSPCGHVSVTMNGIGEVQSVQIAPAMVTGGDAEATSTALASAVAEATNAAGAAAKQCYASAIGQMARDMDLNMPGVEGMLSSLTGGA